MQHCSSAWLIIKLAGVEIQLARLNPQCYGKEVTERRHLDSNPYRQINSNIHDIFAAKLFI